MDGSCDERLDPPAQRAVLAVGVIQSRPQWLALQSVRADSGVPCLS
jgi:hypothetical protein